MIFRDNLWNAVSWILLLLTVLHVITEVNAKTPWYRRTKHIKSSTTAGEVHLEHNPTDESHSSQNQNPESPGEIPPPMHWSTENSNSVQIGQETTSRTTSNEEILKNISKSVMSELKTVAAATADSASKVASASQELIFAITNQTLSLADVLAYLPELILLDGPKQLVETLKIIRDHAKTKNHGALDTVILFLEEGDSSTAKKIREKTWPALAFLPQLVQTIGTFIKKVFEAIFGVKK